MRKTIVRPPGHEWRENFSCYASQWGFRCGSEVAKLIGYLRDEFRVKYASEYFLLRVGKNKYQAIPGLENDSGIVFALAASARFRVTLLGEAPAEDLAYAEQSIKEQENQ